MVWPEPETCTIWTDSTHENVVAWLCWVSILLFSIEALYNTCGDCASTCMCDIRVVRISCKGIILCILHIISVRV